MFVICEKVCIELILGFVGLCCVLQLVDGGYVQITRSGFQVTEDMRINQNMSIEVQPCSVLPFALIPILRLLHT
jgi:hypothetical protein